MIHRSEQFLGNPQTLRAVFESPGNLANLNDRITDYMAIKGY
jgi:hypothetical protein